PDFSEFPTTQQSRDLDERANERRRQIPAVTLWRRSTRAIALELSAALPIANRRYGRLQICATKTRALNAYFPFDSSRFPSERKEWRVLAIKSCVIPKPAFFFWRFFAAASPWVGSLF